MAFTTLILRKQTIYIIILVFALVVFWVFLSTNVWDLKPIPLENELEFTWENSPHKNVYNTKLFDLDFKYILTANSCMDHDFLAVIIVTSHYNNVETRSAMRRAFSHDDLLSMKMKRVFLLGQATESVYMTQASILHESKRFGDIIQGNFLEAYRNLTYKHIMGLKWVSENCKTAKYVIKMDDDIVFNVIRVAEFLNSTYLPKNSIGGYILRNMKPIREPANKWYVTSGEYRFSKYPSFVSGWFYITTPEIASKLVLLSHYFKYFWIDDVYVTGILTKSLKIRLYELRRYFTLHPEFLQCCIAGVKKSLDCDILVGPNGGDNNLFYEFNEAIKVCESGRCQKRAKPINETCVAERKINLKSGSSIIENYKLR